MKTFGGLCCKSPELYTASGKKMPVFNTFRPRQNGRHFADDIFNCIFYKKIFEFQKSFIEICSLRSSWQYIGISSDNGLSPGRHQATVCANVDIVHRRPQWVNTLFHGQNRCHFAKHTKVHTWERSFVLRLKFPKHLFLCVQLTNSQHYFT